MDKNTIHETNKNYWNNNLNDFLGAIILPHYGAFTKTEEELNLFGNVSGKKLLDVGCGNGMSLVYHGSRGAEELWGMDISEKQIETAKENIKKAGYEPKLFCSPMEEECGIPKNYFDFVYSIYAIGWTTDLQHTFNKFASYLKKDGVFIFSWTHPIHYCTEFDGNGYKFHKSYLNENWEPTVLNGNEVSLCNRKISTYINALIKAGFVIEYIDEQTNEETMNHPNPSNDEFMNKAKTLPVTLIIKARKI